MNSTLFCGAEARILLLILLLYYYYYYYYYFQLTQTLVFSNFRLYFLTSVPTELCKYKCGILEDKKKVLKVSIYRSIHNLYIKKYAPKYSVKILEKPNRTRDIWGLLFFFFRFFGKDYTTNQIEVFRHLKNHMLGTPVENEAEVRLLCL